MSSGGIEDGFLAGIAINDRHTCLFGLFKPAIVEFDDHKLYAQALQDLCYLKTHASATGNDDVVGKSGIRDVGRLERFMAKPTLLQCVYPCRLARNQRRERHRQNGAGQYQRIKIAADRIRREPHSCQNKGKLTDLKEAESDGQRDDISIFENSSNERENKPLACAYDQNQNKNLPDMIQ